MYVHIPKAVTQKAASTQLKAIQSLLLSGILFCLLLAGCHPKDTPNAGPLVDSTLVTNYSNATLKSLIPNNDSLPYAPKDFEVQVFRLTYTTKLPDETSIQASGVVYVPRQLNTPNQSYPLLSLHHATIFTKAQAPSTSNLTTPSFSYALLFATHGNIVVCPDYIGYGKSDQFSHPYEHRQTLAQASVDMLRAARQFLEARKTPHSTQVFLAGYSEGGFASLSTQKMIEEQYSDISVTAASCGAGPYVAPSFFEFVTKNATGLGLPNYLYVWQTLSYNQIYKINKPISYYFKAPYADQIAQSLDVTLTFSANFAEICTDAFKKDILDPTSDFGKALADNNLANWLPKGKLYLLHGQRDEYIPYLNSQKVYESMKAKGAPVTFTSVANGYHTPTEITYMRRTVEWFEKLKK